MIRPDGKAVKVSWGGHEILWLQAAISPGMTRRERREAFEDIASMTGRTFASVHYQAQKLEDQKREADRRASQGAQVVQRAGFRRMPPAIIATPSPLQPSLLNTSTKVLAMRMGCR